MNREELHDYILKTVRSRMDALDVLEWVLKDMRAIKAQEEEEHKLIRARLIAELKEFGC